MAAESDDSKTQISAQKSTVQSAAIEPGRFVGGRYQIVSLLGRGGMGLVYKVNHVMLKKEFALKTMDTKGISPLTVQRFQQEAKAAFALNHPNIVSVKEFGVLEDQTPFLVMEILQGETLGERLSRSGCMKVEEALPIFVQICFALAYAHEQGVIHRDIKPNNIMLIEGVPLTKEGSIKIVDFGIAKLAASEGGEIQALTRTGEIFGSPLYMSPEQCYGGRVDRRADIYSAGCVFYEVLTGAPPCVGENALATMMKHQKGEISSLKEASLGTEFPLALEVVIARMLEKSPDDRYQDLGSVANDLGAILRGDPTLNGSLNAKSAERKKAKGDLSMSKGKSSILVLGLLILVATISGAIGYRLHKNDSGESLQFARSDSAHTAQRKSDERADDSRIATAGENAGAAIEVVAHSHDQKVVELKRFLETGRTVKSELVMSQTKRRLDFPDTSLGLITGLKSIGGRIDPGYESIGPLKAQNVVIVPAGVRLCLEVGGVESPQIFEIPSVLKAIDVKEFSGLTIKFSEDYRMLNKNIESAVAAIVRIAYYWPNCSQLSLVNVRANEAALQSLYDMKQLDTICLSGAQSALNSAESQPFLQRLKVVVLKKLPADKMIRIIAGSSCLNALRLSETEVSPESLAELARCPHLEVLNLDHLMFSNEMLPSIRKIKSLRTLILHGAATLSPAQRRLLPGVQIEQFKL